jgi:hypothetical protein
MINFPKCGYKRNKFINSRAPTNPRKVKKTKQNIKPCKEYHIQTSNIQR